MRALPEWLTRRLELGRGWFLNASPGVSAPNRQFTYIPWIAEHGDALMKAIDPSGELLTPLPLFRNLQEQGQRAAITRFVRQHPARFRNFVLESLGRLRGDISGVLLSLDWTPAMRQIVYACRSLDIPTVLVPHESVFANRGQFYLDTRSGADYPICDAVLCWGALQRDVFVERGYPASRIQVLGSPKIDAARFYQPALQREQFCALYELRSDQPVVVFALQPLDSQLDERTARASQRQAVSDALGVCEELGAQLLLRDSPAGRWTLSRELRRTLRRAKHARVDKAEDYRTTPLETLAHADAILSVNSTMLLEGALMGKPALATKYLDFESSWAPAGIPIATNRASLRDGLSGALSGKNAGLSPEGERWVASQFARGEIDGRSLERIRAALTAFQQAPPAPLLDDLTAHLFAETAQTGRFGTAALHRIPNRSMAHVDEMLGFRRLLHAPRGYLAATADIFVRWGTVTTEAKSRQLELARQLGRPVLVIEDGYLRSRDIGLSGTPGLSITVDTVTAHYDATVPSRLERRLNSDLELTDAQLARARQCIENLRTHRLCKYNHAPDTKQRYGKASRSVLVVDQRFGDASVSFGKANEASFRSMLECALGDAADCNILVKRHPDAALGGKETYLNDAALAPFRADPRVVLIDEQVNPHTLFDQVQRVYVVTSGLGMEALIAGVPVTCFGSPYYAGWGLTQDASKVQRRQRHRALEDVFHFAYIEASRYYSPDLGRVAEIEDVIEYLRRTRSP